MRREWLALVVLCAAVPARVAGGSDVPSHAHVRMGSGEGYFDTGEFIPIDVTLATDVALGSVVTLLPFEIASLEPRVIPVAPGPDTVPCVPNPALAMPTTNALYPPGCRPLRECEGVLVTVGPDPSGRPIPSGTVLYTCTYIIVSAHPTAVPIPCVAFHATTVGGESVDSSCEEGVMVVLDPPLPTPRPTPTPTPILLIGDCNGDQRVSVNELVMGVQIVLGQTGGWRCPALDCGEDGPPGIDCLVTAVVNALASPAVR